MNISAHICKTLQINEISQIGIVVENIDKTLDNYSNLFGITFPKVFVPEYFNRKYKGKPGNFKIKVALGMMNQLQVELIEALEGNSIHKDFLEQKGEGLHHFGFDVDNIDERIEALHELGIGVLMSGERIGARFAYVDTERLTGVIFEFIEREKKM